MMGSGAEGGVLQLLSAVRAWRATFSCSFFVFFGRCGCVCRRYKLYGGKNGGPSLVRVFWSTGRLGWRYLSYRTA